MRLFSIRGAEVRISPALLAAIPAAAALGGVRMLLTALLSLSVHEAAHAMAAHRLGYSVGSIEIQPFGFVARLGMQKALPADAAAIYAAGPVASLSMAGLSSLLEGLIPLYREASLGFTEYNLLIAAVNLLPALPLDGGRLLLAALSGKRAAARILRALGTLTGAIFIAAFALLLINGAFNPTFLIMGVFLVIAAIKEKDASFPKKLSPARLLKGRALTVHQIALSEESSLSAAISLLPPGGYAVVSVVDESGGRSAELDEKQLRDAAVILGASAKIREAVALYAGKML